ncbi:MAG: restriction endonuclease subunit S [Acidobacteriota bacterium]|nr:restriction endonuclease subunit S [Acidobacteriota bacterium]
MAFITDDQAVRLKGVSLKPGDLLLNITGDGITFSRCCLVPTDILPACVNQHVAIIRVNPGIAHPEFVLSYLTHPGVKTYIEGFNSGGSRRAITKEHIESFRLALPPLHEQRAIAHILGTLDDKIELNRRLSETLEAMARALFKSWFVDFDPVHAKMEGRNPGLAEALSHLFPTCLAGSELGETPNGWGVVPLPSAIHVNPARPLRKGEIAPFLDMANMPTRGHSPDEVIERPFGSGMRFVNGDTLVARITPCLENGKTAYVDFLKEGQVGWGSTEYIVLRPKPPLPEEFAYCLARSRSFREFVVLNMTGSSGRQRVPTDSLAHFKIVVPPKPVAESFGRLIKPLFARSTKAINEGRTLASLRDLLLPKLVSGELKLEQAERFLEGVIR